MPSSEDGALHERFRDERPDFCGVTASRRRATHGLAKPSTTQASKFAGRESADRIL